MKIPAFSLAAAALVVLFAAAAASGPAARGLDDSLGAESASAPALRSSKQAHSIPRVRPPRSAGQSKAIAYAQEGEAGAGSEGAATYDGDEPVPEDIMPENRSLYPWEPSPQFWQWRRTWADEAPDTGWSKQIRGDLSRWTAGRPGATATLHEVDCRETICQLYLHADNAQDAEALFASMGKDGLEVAHEQMAGYVHLGDAPSGGTIYELVVRRERPTWMPPHVAGAGHAYFLALDAREGIE